MTNAIISKTKDGRYKSIVCMGHANYARSNEKDMVCAAISVLVINTINSISELTIDANNMKVDTNEENGFIQCKFKNTISDETQLLMSSLEIGLQSIKKQYGKKYFELKFEEV